jgi:Tol biopolymer transport system component
MSFSKTLSSRAREHEDKSTIVQGEKHGYRKGKVHSIPRRLEMKVSLVLVVLMLGFVAAQTTPTVFAPEIISGDDEEFRITFTPDGKTAYFARSPAGAWFPFSRQATIYETRLEGNTWTTPKVASFSGEYSDIDPFITPDGTKLYFSSIRPVNGKAREDTDMWMLEWDGNEWSKAVHLGETVNSSSDELYPSLDEAGILYFGSDRDMEMDGWNIYRAVLDDAGVYGPVEKLSQAVNSPFWDFNPTITSDGTTLYFVSLDRPGGKGLGDIYVSRLEDNAWTGAELLDDTINTTSDEFHPSLSPDEGMLFFVRHNGDHGDLFSVER